MTVEQPVAVDRVGRVTSAWSVARLPTLALIPLAAFVWWIVGFLPWVLDGFGGSTFRQASGLRAQWLAIPLYNGSIGGLVLGAGTGGLLVGLVALLGRDGPVRSAIAAASGGLLAMIAILVLTRDQIGHGNTGQGFTADDRVVNGLTIVVVLMTVVGTLVGLLGLAGSLGRGLALGGLAGAVGVWTVDVLHAAGWTDPGGFGHTADVGHWTGAVVLAVALVTLGARPIFRLIAWPVAVLLAWFVAPTVTASSYIEALLRPGYGSRVGDTISAAAHVWRMASSPGVRSLTPWITAIVVAGVIVVGREVAVRRAGDSAATDASH